MANTTLDTPWLRLAVRRQCLGLHRKPSVYRVVWAALSGLQHLQLGMAAVQQRPAHPP